MRRSCLVCLLATACAQDPVVDPAPSPVAAVVPTPTPAPIAATTALAHDAAPPARADEALAVMESRCGLCHLPDISEQPRALTVFDLSHTDWSAGLTDEQLLDIETRLVDGDAAFDEVDAVRTYLDAARQLRLQPEPLVSDC